MSHPFEPEAALAILERTVKSYDPKTEEHFAIELGAKALLFIHASGQHGAFREYLESFSQGLTDEQKKLLAAMGLE